MERRMRLRMSKPAKPLHVVLVNPEIPQNTGNIARLCAATGSTLHLVGELGFSTSDKAVRRAGLDYWHLVTVMEHPNLEHCLKEIGETTPLLISTGAAHSFKDAPYTPGCTLVFGAESKGLPQEIRDKYTNTTFGIPTCSKTVRSLNLGNAASIVVFKALEVIGNLDESTLEPS